MHSLNAIKNKSKPLGNATAMRRNDFRKKSMNLNAKTIG
jgi:hypothetical protein